MVLSTAYRITIFTVCAILVAHSSAALAQTQLDIESLPQDDSPVQIVQCRGGFFDSRYTANYYFGANCAIHVVDPKRTATTVRFRFRFEDAFDEKVGGFITDADGPFAPRKDVALDGRRISSNGTFFRVLNTYDGARSVEVAVDRVRFDDGSIWTADLPAEQRAADAAPKPSVPANYVTPDPNMTPTPQ